MSRYLIMPSPAQVGTEIVTSGLVGHWDAGNSSSYTGSGTTWTDLSGSSRTGTLTNGPTFSADRGGKLVFDGTDDMVSVTGSVSVSAATFVAWIRRSGTQGNYAGIMLARDITGGAGKDTNGIMFFSTTHNLGYIWEEQAATWQWNSGLAIPDGVWCMVAASVSASSATLYVCTSSGIVTATNTTTHAATTIGGDYFRLGMDQVSASTYRGLKGDAAVFQLYNRALSASEITQNFNATRGRFLPDSSALAETQHVTSGLTLYWDAGNSASYIGSGSTWTDLQGNTNGTLTNSPTYTQQLGGGIVLDGTDDFIDVPSYSNPASETVIVFAKSETATWSDLTFLSCDRGKNGHILSPESPTANFRFYVLDNAATPNAYALGTAFSPGDITKPTMYAISTNGSNLHKGYVNGSLIHTLTTSITRGTSETSTRWHVGFDDVNVTPARYGNCTVYAVLRYNRQLTDAEITQNFNAFRGRFGI